jgi:hypothetical protein
MPSNEAVPIYRHEYTNMKTYMYINMYIHTYVSSSIDIFWYSRLCAGVFRIEQMAAQEGTSSQP